MSGAVVEPFGESAILVQFPRERPERAWELAHCLARYAAKLPGVVSVVPTFDSTFLQLDLGVASADETLEPVRALCARLQPADPGPSPREFVVPVVYGGERGPDLADLASHVGMAVDDLVRRHTAEPLTVRAIAGPVGGPMMSAPAGLPDVPRRTSPRATVWRGAVLLAGRQAFVKTMPGPGGWQIIGTTPLVLIDLTDHDLVPWRPGDRLRFAAIDERDWPRFEGRRPVPQVAS